MTSELAFLFVGTLLGSTFTLWLRSYRDAQLMKLLDSETMHYVVNRDLTYDQARALALRDAERQNLLFPEDK